MASNDPLTGGYWRTTDDGRHIYIKNGRPVAGLDEQAGKGPLSHVVHDDGSVTTASGVKVDRAVLVDRSQKSANLKEISKRFVDPSVDRGQALSQLVTPMPSSVLEAHKRYEKETFKDYVRNVKSKLTTDEKNAIENYMGEEYQTINPSLRSGAEIESGSTADHLMKAIDKAGPTKEDLTLYRNIKSFPDELIPKVGETATMAGFLSTAVSPHPHFVSEGGTAFEIHVPKGSKGLIGGMNIDEREWIIKHGAKLKYLGKVDGVKYGKMKNTAHFFTYEG